MCLRENRSKAESLFNINLSEISINNLNKIIDSCNVDLDSNIENLLPKYPVDDSYEYLCNLSKKGLSKRLNNEIPNNYIERLNYGLYTCNFDVYQSLANRIRVELCINQEGLFKIKDNNVVSLAKAKTNEIDIESRSPKTFKDKVFDGGDKVVIGKQIGTISSVGNNNSHIYRASSSVIDAL